MNFKITELKNFNWIWKRRVLKQVLPKICLFLLCIFMQKQLQKKRKGKERKKKKDEWANINENEEQD